MHDIVLLQEKGIYGIDDIDDHEEHKPQYYNTSCQAQANSQALSKPPASDDDPPGNYT